MERWFAHRWDKAKAEFADVLIGDGILASIVKPKFDHAWDEAAGPVLREIFFAAAVNEAPPPPPAPEMVVELSEAAESSEEEDEREELDLASDSEQQEPPLVDSEDQEEEYGPSDSFVQNDNEPVKPMSKTEWRKYNAERFKREREHHEKSFAEAYVVGTKYDDRESDYNGEPTGPEDQSADELRGMRSALRLLNQRGIDAFLTHPWTMQKVLPRLEEGYFTGWGHADNLEFILAAIRDLLDIPNFSHERNRAYTTTCYFCNKKHPCKFDLPHLRAYAGVQCVTLAKAIVNIFTVCKRHADERDETLWTNETWNSISHACDLVGDAHADKGGNLNHERSKKLKKSL